jgi:general secretion pathway protein G
MAPLIPSGKRISRRAFTLIELMIVITVIGILLTIAVPQYRKALIRANESVLRSNLFTLRTMIDEYTYDKQKAPQTLQDLVEAGYLRQVPIDPITKNNTGWRTIMEDALSSANQTEPGIFDVRSSAEGNGLDGTPYSDW